MTPGKTKANGAVGNDSSWSLSMALGKLPDNPNLGKDGKDWQSTMAEGDQEIPSQKH